MRIRHEFYIDPVPKPRMTKSDKWKKRTCVEKYWDFKDKICLMAKSKNFQFPDEGAKVHFIIKMPKSWSEKKRKEMEGKGDKQKPDLDNLLKALKDALLKEDCTVWDLGGLRKTWGRQGMIIIDV